MRRRYLNNHFAAALIAVLCLVAAPVYATQQWTNNATSVIANSGGITSGAVSLTVTTGHGDRFPAVASPHYFMATLVDSSGNREIIKVTTRSAGSNTMTIARAQEGTSARAFAQGSLIDLRVTKAALDELSKASDINYGTYVADPSAADQGATTNSRSIASLLTSIGTSKSATIVLAHSGSGNTTTYTIGQNVNWSAYTNVTFKIEPGAILQIATGTTTTIYGKVIDGHHQMFSQVGTGIVRFGPGSIYRFRPEMWGARVDNSTDDGPYINAMFASARASDDLGLGPWIEFPNGQMKISTSINAGGFGNTYVRITGNGNYTSSNLNGVMTGGVVLDLTGNEQGEMYGVNVFGDSVTTPDIGVLVSSAVIAGGIRGGNMHIHENHISGYYNVAAYYQYGTDLNNLWNNRIGSGGTGVAIAISSAAVPTLAVSSAYYTLDVSGGGLTTHRQGHNIISLSGTGRAFQFIESLSSVYSSYGDTYQFTGSVAKPFMEIINSGQSFNIQDVRSEGSGNASFIKTDGLTNSTITGTVQSSADLTTPLIDVSAAYGTGDGYIAASYIRLAPSGAGGYLFNTTGDGGLLGNIIQLAANQSMTVNGTKNTASNLIINKGTGTVTLNDGNSDDDGNIILSRSGFAMNGGTGGGTGANIKNHLSGTASLDYGVTAANTCDDKTITVTGAADGDTVTVGVPNALATYAGHNFTGFVSAANTVTVRRCNVTTGTVADPAAATVRADVWKH